ncbi:MAG: hypothetical protein KI793_32030 [Rivularia sp. (in: Bacteria)]|nr:hypothetical protein [Rivularia sp. MS3]
MENLESAPILIILIYLVLQTLFNLVVRSLLVVGSIIVIKRVSKWYSWCLFISSIIFLICYIPTAAIVSFVLARNFSPQQYALFFTVVQIFKELALLIFGVGFIGLSRQFNRNQSRR